MADDCLSCPEGMPLKECPKSKRPCGHHCNCSWIHDCCHWCGGVVDEIDPETFTVPAQADVNVGLEAAPVLEPA